MTDAWINLAINYFMRATQPSAEDPDSDLRQALRALEKPAAMRSTNVLVDFYQCEIHKEMGERARARGIDPRTELLHALEAYRRGLGINPKLPHLHNGIGITYMDEAMEAWDRGEDPAPSLEHARAAFAEAIAEAPEQGFAYNNLGDLLCLRAGFERARDEDPRATIAAAVSALNQAIARIPDHPRFWANLARAHTILAAYELDHGREPQSTLRAASSALRKALDKNASDAPALRTRGETLALGARIQARRGPGNTGPFEAATRAFQKAVDLAPGVPKYPLAFAEFYRTWATSQPSDIDADSRLERGITLVDPLLARRPIWPDAQVVRASLRLAQAQRAAGNRERRARAALAAEDFASALTGNPALEKVWQRQAALARVLAATPPSIP
jgi:tetratricopeptide (TPR) repeat protein